MNNNTNNKQEDLEEFKKYVEQYRRIEEEYQSLSIISHEKKDSLLWELDYIRDEICSLKLYLEGLIRKKDDIINQINDKDILHQKEKDDRIAELLKDTDDTTYYINIEPLVKSLLKELNLNEDTANYRVLIDVDSVYSNIDNISDYLLAVYYKHGDDYTESIPVMFYIETNNPSNELIIIEWFCPLTLPLKDSKRLIDCLKIDNKISSHGSEVTRLVYTGDYKNLIIPCKLKDIFYDGLNITSENPEYDSEIHNSLINAITQSLETEDDKVLIKKDRENNNGKPRK